MVVAPPPVEVWFQCLLDMIVLSLNIEDSSTTEWWLNSQDVSAYRIELTIINL